ncbi:cob(I)yrinic acid a,c-diamide adenosyltransferase [Marinilongibacter aquaticus]|uniref:cob(I)yrinic acid a,c-diamide adenosyltransferase n=1 Tax=Marinilongibacter aquaticus TaxID=2975157 RepID=UPI0021BD00A8|nr:cob(I)yrinic acid a,c-diamide adenosyltransferase [Marinilongibacter aquaticus]UBM57733.1 cob(I)yrinic acid a,c-diamide adenosyltransferase [Marinilongibacter aquaticus]
MAKIYTKTGDLGETSLWGGERVSKAALRMEAIGSLDELNAWIGLVRDQSEDGHEKDVLLKIQNRLFVVGALLADSRNKASESLKIEQSAVEELELEMDTMVDKLPELKHFILPGGHAEVSHVHLARTVSRRAERQTVRLHDTEKLDPLVIVWLNRLSDYLFILARKRCQDLNVEEVKWIPD